MGMPCLSAGDAFWRAPAKPAVPGGGGTAGALGAITSRWSRVQLKQYRVNEGLWSLRRNRWFSHPGAWAPPSPRRPTTAPVLQNSSSGGGFSVCKV